MVPVRDRAPLSPSGITPAAGWRRGGSLAAVLVVGLGVLNACANAPLADTREGPSEVAQAVLDALAARDRGMLQQLALSEREFREHVWPELPASRPERNLTVEFVWGDLAQKSEASLSRAIASYGGRRHELLEVKFLGQTTNYAGYAVHRESALRVRLLDGTEAELRLFGSMIEKDGRWKVFSYVVD